MSRAGLAALVAVALAAGLALRVARLAERPMHHDEANQAVKFGALLEEGEYRYDAHDHHGPTLYYLTLPSAWLRGQATLAALDEHTVRLVPVAFGAATLLVLPLLGPGIGRAAVAAAAWLLAVSPAMVFYSRVYIQEALFAALTLLLVVAVGRVATGGGWRWVALAGTALGLLAATKETTVIVVPAALLAALAAWWSMGPARPRTILAAGTWARVIGLAAVTAVLVVALFYSSFLTHPTGLVDLIRAVPTYLDRGLDPTTHAQPWHYYLGLLAWHADGGLRWSEGLVLALAAVGLLGGWYATAGAPADARFWARYLALDVLLAALVFSAIRYKTPWNLLPFYVVAFPLAGLGVAMLVSAARWRVAQVALLAGLAIGAAQLGQQAWRAAVPYGADPRNPYVYAHTVPDAVRMATRIRDLAAVSPAGSAMQVSVIAPPHEQWPLPWYLRRLPNVGYWAAAGDPAALQAPVVVASVPFTEALDAALGERYVSEFYGLRPEVLQALYVERGLWERYLARVAGTPAPAAASCGPGADCAPAAAVALWPAAHVR